MGMGGISQSGLDNFASGNHPGATSCPVSFSTDTELSFYSGIGLAMGSVSNNVLASTWKYSLQSNQFAYSGGPLLASALPKTPIYGTTFSSSNNPGSRYGSCYKQDGDSLYIFGGRFDADGGHFEKDLLTELWESKISTKEWKVITDVYSYEKNISSSFTGTIYPGSRYLCTMSKIGNKIYIFGGHGYLSSIHGRISDLFSYDLQSDTWSFEGGYQTANENSVIGVADELIGGRSEASGWVYKGIIYFFGGWGFGTTSVSYVRLNDVWTYTPDGTKKFTFISGLENGGIHSDEVKGITGEFSSSNLIGTRYSASVFSDANDFVVLIGGKGQKDMTPEGQNFFYNDAWIWSNSLSQWKYISGGGNETGTFGTTYSQTNHIGGRYCMGHWHKGNLFYLFGGIGLCDQYTDKTFCSDLFSFKLNDQDYTYFATDEVYDGEGSRIGSKFSIFVLLVLILIN